MGVRALKYGEEHKLHFTYVAPTHDTDTYGYI